MQNKEITVVTKAENMMQNITMESGGIELDGVEIVREMPVSIKGDTIVYNTLILLGEERKLEDVLRNYQVLKSWLMVRYKLKVKKVTKLFVNGKPFMDGDTKLIQKYPFGCS
jgi:hypothetical protein